MVAFNFKPDFKPKIMARKKRSTIRSTKRCELLDTMQLYTGQRTKKCKKMFDAYCIGIAPIEIHEKGWRIFSKECEGLCIIHGMELHQQEGFDSIDQMVEFFRKEYGLPYKGWIHVWDENPTLSVSLGGL